MSKIETIYNSSLITDELNKISSIRPIILTHLTLILNKYHNSTRREKYYDILAGDWLDLFIHNICFAILEGDKHAESCSKIPVVGTLEAFDKLRIQEGWLNHLSYAVAQLNNETFEKLTFEMDKVVIHSSKPSFKDKLLTFIGSKTPGIVIVKPYFKDSRINQFKAFWNWRNFAVFESCKLGFEFTCSVDIEWRNSCSLNIKSDNSLERVIKSLIPLYIPVYLLEGLSRYHSIVSNKISHRPRALYSAQALYGNTVFKLLAAEWQEKGTLLLYHQHGGNYGTDLSFFQEEYEMSLSDVYYTFGWGESKGGTRPMTTAFPKIIKKSNNKILLMCGDYPEFPYKFFYGPMPGTFEKVSQNTVEFVKKIINEKSLFIRLKENNNHYNLKSTIVDLNKNLVFDNFKKTSFSRFSESRLVVHNYLSTSYLETLALNIPTVCFYDAEHTYRFRKQAQPFIDELENVGILHRTAESAAEFVNEVESNPEDWWNSIDVQEARRSFCEQYANFSHEWKDLMEEEFKRILSLDYFKNAKS